MSKNKKLFSFLINYYQVFVTKVERHWEVLHPKSFSGYTLCKTGLNLYMKDLNVYIVSRGKYMVGSSIGSFNRNELNVYRKFPSMILKSLPILSTSLIPGSMTIIPFLFLFPKYLLTPYFWSENQKSKFFQEDVKVRQMFVEKLKEDFQNEIKQLLNSKTISSEVFESCQALLSDSIKNKEIHDFIPFFETYFNISILPTQYRWNLKHCYPISRSYFMVPRAKLERFNNFIAYEDRHLSKENLDELSDSDLFELCLTRGLNPYVFERKDALEYIKLWTKYSCYGEVTDFSYRLHLILVLSAKFQNKSKHES